MKDTLQPGLTARLEYPVPAGRTVPQLLPESAEFAAMPPVLATGYLVGLLEWACIRAVVDHLDGGEQTLGVHIDVSHQAPTPPGDILEVRAELTEVDGRVLTFIVEANDEAAVISRGTHRRAVIDRARFDHRINARTRDGAAQAQR